MYCDDCRFYATTFISQDLEIFGILKLMGIDLGKNLTDEPTGVWCVRNESGDFLDCEQVYQAVGEIANKDILKLKYENWIKDCGNIFGNRQ